MKTENKLALARGIMDNMGDVAFIPTNGHFKRLIELSYPLYFEEDVKREDITEQRIDEAVEAKYRSGTSYYKQMDDLAALYIKPLVKRFDMLRRKIIPFVNDMVAYADQSYQKEFTLEADIRNVIVPAIYGADPFIRSLSTHNNFSNVSLKTIEFIGGFQAREEEDILKVITSGSTIMDDMLVEMIASYPKGWLKEIYDTYFVEGNQFATTIPANTIVHHVDRAIVCYFIIGHHIANNIVDPNINMTLDAYNRYMANLFSNIGGFIYRYITVLNTRISTGELVYDYDRKENVVYVFQNQYEAFIAKGGSVDAILGALLNNDNAYMIPTLENKTAFATAYAESYNKRVEEKEQRFRSQVLGSFAGAFRAAYEKADSETRLFICSVDEPITAEPDPMGLDSVIEMYAQQLETTGARNPFDIYIHAMLNTGLAKKYRFDNLYARVSIMSENMEPSVAAFYVAVEDVVEAILDTCITIDHT